MLAFALILAALGFLAAGVATETVVLSGVALGAAVVALALLLVPWARPRARTRRSAVLIPPNRETEQPPVPLVEATGTTTPAPAPDAACSQEPLTGGVEPDGGDTSRRVRTVERTATTTLPAPFMANRTALVLVVPGRHRYHREGCPLLSGRETQRLARDEAEEEGFTACTRCSATRMRSRP